MIRMKETQHNDEQTLEDMARAIPKDSPLRGPNGNVIVFVDWKSVQGERWSDYEGGLVSARVSDWDKAEVCHHCGRKIVHVYYVYNVEDGTVYAYGKDHAHFALGYREPLRRKQLTNIEAEIQRFNRQKALRKEEVETQLLGSWEKIRYSARAVRGLNLRKMAQEGFLFFWSEIRQEGIIYPLHWGDDDPVFQAIVYDLQLEKIKMSGLRELREFLESKGIETT